MKQNDNGILTKILTGVATALTLSIIYGGFNIWKQSIIQQELNENIQYGQVSIMEELKEFRQDVNDKFVNKDEFDKECERNTEGHRQMWRKINQFYNGAGE